VLAETEREVRGIDTAGHVEAIGGRAEDALVAIRGGVEQHEPVAFPEPSTTEPGVAGDGAPERLDRRHPAQALLDGRTDARAIVNEQVALLGMLRQGKRAPRDEVTRRLVPGDEQREAVPDGLGRVHGATVDLGRRECRHDVVARVAPTLANAVDEEAIERREIV
jgi:hypothetical protein